MSIFIACILFIIGLAVLVYGAQWLVSGASHIAKKLGVSSLIIGLTIVAFGTSMPELVVSVYSAWTGASEIALGNVVGSNIANILLILGVASIIVPMKVSASTVRWEIPFALLASLAVLVMGSDALLGESTSGLISRGDGIILLGFFAIFMYYIFALAKHHAPVKEDHGASKVSMSSAKATALVVGGLGGLIIGGKLLVDSAVTIAVAAGLSETVIGLTVVAVGTSLPEFATSVVAAMKKQMDIAIGNIVGSSIFNVFWILGVSAIISPLPAVGGFAVDALVMIGATLLLFVALYIGKKSLIERWQGVLFIFVYVAYVVYLLV
jgi:cation:H+ antiporter